MNVNEIRILRDEGYNGREVTRILGRGKTAIGNESARNTVDFGPDSPFAY